MEHKTDAIIFTGSFDYYEICILSGTIVILSINDNNAVIHPFAANNNHKILLWYSWYYGHYKMTNGKETTNTIVSLFFAQNSENYSYTLQEVNTTIYFILQI